MIENKQLLENIVSLLESIDKRLRGDDGPPNEDEFVSSLRLSTRARRVLMRLEIETVRDVRRCSNDAFLLQRNCGKSTLNEIRRSVMPNPPPLNGSMRDYL